MTYMARLPKVGGDEGNWGEILNDFLLQAHTNDGSLKASDDIAQAKAVAASAVQSVNGKFGEHVAVTAGDVGAYVKPEGGIPLADLDASTQGSIAATKLVAVHTQTADYELELGDAGCAVEITSASAVTVTVPKFASTAFAVGSTIEIVQMGLGQVTIVPADGVTIDSARNYDSTNHQFSSVTLRKRAADTWLLSGDTAARPLAALPANTVVHTTANDITYGHASSPLVLAKPVNTVDGDVLVAFVATRSDDYTITPPEGWTRIGANPEPYSLDDGSMQAFYFRVPTASALPADWAWTTDNSRDLGMIFRVSGVNGGSVPLLTNPQVSAGTSGYAIGGEPPLLMNALDIATGGCAILLLASFWTAAESSITTPTVPSGFENIGGMVTATNGRGVISAWSLSGTESTGPVSLSWPADGADQGFGALLFTIG